MKTPEEIKHALEYCASDTRINCKGCPYMPGAWNTDEYCADVMKRDALEYIKRLESGKRPRWEKTQYAGYLTCSECHNVFIMHEWVKDGKWKYCPNCGTKLEVET